MSKKDNINSIIWGNNNGDLVVPPKFYLEKQIPIFTLPSSKKLKKLQTEIISKKIKFPEYFILLE